MATVCPFPAFGDANIALTAGGMYVALTAAGMPYKVILPLDFNVDRDALGEPDLRAVLERQRALVGVDGLHLALHVGELGSQIGTVFVKQAAADVLRVVHHDAEVEVHAARQRGRDQGTEAGERHLPEGQLTGPARQHGQREAADGEAGDGQSQ